MSTENKVIVVNKLIGQPQPPEIHLSKIQTKAIKWMKTRFIEDGLLTTSDDLQQFVRSRSPQGINATVRKFAQRLVETGAAERLEDGIFIPAGYRNLLKDIDIKTLAKIRNKRQRNEVIKAQNEFLNFVKPMIANKQNKWCIPLTQISVKFNVNGLYEKVKELNIVEKHDKYYLIPFNYNEEYNNRKFGFKAAFHIYKNKIILKLGDQDCPLRASENIILTAILICRNYLIQTNKFWNFNLEIPQAREWLINIPSIYTITLNQDYIKIGKSIKDETLGYELADKGNCLILKQKLYLSNVKPNQLFGLFNKFYPLNILNLEPLKIFQKQTQKVTFSNKHENSNFSKTNSKSHVLENFLEKTEFHHRSENK